MEKFFLGFNRKERKDGAKRFIKHISQISFLLLIYSKGKVHKGVVGKIN